MSTRNTRTRLAALLTAGAVALALAGCGGDDDKKSAPEEDEASPTAKVEGDPDTWPLTGLEVEAGGSSIKKHPVLVLKMDNTGASAPQRGLGDADMVVEELVEGGLTRLAVFYYENLPEVAGPVRSMRASDIGIVAPVDGSMITSGAAGVTIRRLKKAGIEFFSEGAKGLARDNGRSAPYNLFADVQTVGREASGKPARPVDYLPFGEAADLPKGQPARSIDAQFSGGHVTSWKFNGQGYVNDNTFAKKGDEFPADTVLVLRVKVGDAGYLDPAGNPVPETKLKGQGAALLFTDGRLVRGTWKKSGLDSPLQLTTKAGKLIVPAGRTWIELVPKNGGNVTFK
jgi:hypothetical protein